METKKCYVINQDELELLLKEIDRTAVPRCTIRLTIKKLNLDAKDLSIEEIGSMGRRIEERARTSQAKGMTEVGKGTWVFEEQKLFCSILPYFCLLRGLVIDKLANTDLLSLQRIFVAKTSTLLYFEWKYLDSLTNCFKVEWTEEDINHLKDLMKNYREQSQDQDGIVRWKRISLELLELNHCSKFHSPRDCRQLWINHINPHVSKGSWDAAEDLELFLKIRQYGNKWALISKLMKGVRTQHMIKNRVNSFMKKMKIRAKNFKPAQIDQIIDGLERKLALEEFQTHKFQEMDYQVKVQVESNEVDLPTLVDDKPNRQEQSVLYDVLDLTADRILVTQSEMEDNYQYEQDLPSFNRSMDADLIFEQFLLPEVGYYFYE